MDLDERLRAVGRRQLDLLEELQRARRELIDVRGRTRMKIAELQEHERQAAELYQQAADEEEPDAEAIKEWPHRARLRVEELEAAVAELDEADRTLAARIAGAELDIEDFQILAPQLVARAAAARTAGIGREVFETLNDALSYIEYALQAAQPVDPNGPVRRPPQQAEKSADQV